MWGGRPRPRRTPWSGFFLCPTRPASASASGRGAGPMKTLHGSALDSTSTKGANKNHYGGLIALAIAAYFLYFAIGALRARFAPDDPMNLGFYYDRGFLGCVWDNLRFWSNAYRPMGAAFYLPLYRAFGLNPLPYR